jgi:hypothetical protein
MFLDIQYEILDTFSSGATSFKPIVRTDYGFDSKIGFGYRLQTPAFAATIVVNLALGNYVRIIATANTNITILAPTSVPNIIAFPLIIEVSNTVGGAMGSVTLNAAYLSPSTAAFSTPPANTKEQSAGWMNIGTQAAPVWHQWFIQSSDSGN